jgi:4-amino-4-deoxy-L-arabinose transferase-like glycosyltransferase
MRQANRSALWFALSNPYFVPVCFITYLSLRLGLILAFPIDQYSDNLWYYNRGISIGSGQGYYEGGLPTAYWPPGWPGFLGLLFWLFGPSALVGQIANLTLSGIIFFLVLSVASAIFVDAIVGRLAVLMLTIYPNQIGYVPALATEVLYSALLLLAIFVTIRAKTRAELLLAGIVFGLATLTKAQSLFVPAVLFFAWWLAAAARSRRFSCLGKVAIIYAVMALVICPWTLRNYWTFGEFVLISTNGGGTLLSGNNPSAFGDYTVNDALVQQVPNDVAGQVGNDRLATRLALQWIRDNPIAFAILIPKKIWRLWVPDGESEWSYQAGFRRYEDFRLAFRIVRGLNQLYYTCLIVLFLLSIWYFIRRGRPLETYEVTGYALVVYFTLISLVFSGQSRFHYPLMPWIAMYAAWTMTQWRGKTVPVVGSAQDIATLRNPG